VKNFLYSILPAAIIFICAAELQAQTDSTAMRLASWLKAMEHIGFNGTVLVEVAAKRLLSQGYGLRDRERQLANTPETIFDIGSITKQFTAAAILKLEMLGKLSTDDPLSKYFARVPEDKQHITIHDMLRHQSGLCSNVGRDYDAMSSAAFVDTVLRSPLRFAPGREFSYSNIGYSLLAMIVEQTSGQSWEDFLYTQLWKPAGMEHTGYSRPRFQRDVLAVGYDEEQQLWGQPTDKEWDGDAPYWHLLGNGGVLSTTGDLLRWHHALLGETILSANAKRKLYHPVLRENESGDSYYAYGWDVSVTETGSIRYWHNGTNRVFYADFLRYPDDEVVIIMLCNNAHPYFARLAIEVSRMLFRPHYTPEVPAPDNAINRAFTQRLISLLRDSGLQAAKDQYSRKSPEEDVLDFRMRREGFTCFDNGEPEVAMRIFELNLHAHPRSAKALEALGEGYMETGHKEKALNYFLQSLAIEPDNPFARDMISKLRQ
jgi:CubicO group peptidase (beta-lactamase class C family)